MTSSGNCKNWVVPGGGVEPQEEPHVTAEREALEEAGVTGKLGSYIGMFEVGQILWKPFLMFVLF